MGIDARLPILTTAGWLPAKMIKAGDEIFSYTGRPVKVLSVQEYTPQACYKIWLKEGLTLVVDGRTGIPVYDRKRNEMLKLWTRKTKRHCDSAIYPLSPALIMSYEFGWCRIPVCQPIDPPKRDFPIDPHEMARWVFDRKPVTRLKRTDITRELIERYPRIPTHIPEEYLLGSFQQRLAFLRGIVSTRPGCFSHSTKWFTITQGDLRLAKQIQCLAESLGIKTSMAKRRNEPKFDVKFKTFLRLVEDQVPATRLHELEHRRITKIEVVPPRPCVYIKTEDPNNTILISEGFLTVSL